MSGTNQELLRKYKREMNLRKKCHNELVRLKGQVQSDADSMMRFQFHRSGSEPAASLRFTGNIRVFCRVRPVSQEEQDSADAGNMLSFDSDDDAILYLTNRGKVMTFELDKVFPPQASQEEVSGAQLLLLFLFVAVVVIVVVKLFTVLPHIFWLLTRSTVFVVLQQVNNIKRFSSFIPLVL